MLFDTMHTILLLLILVLAGYIILLHVRLVRKDLIIENIIKKISGIEKDLSVDEIRKVINELHSFQGRTIIFDDKLFDDDVLSFIFSDIKNSNTFIHYTMDEDVASRIMNEGFRFVESFYKTALPVTGDKLDLMIKHNSKKYYGDFIIVISIGDEIVKHYSEELDKEGIKDLSLENVLTESSPVKNENSDNVYILSSHFIRGYVNYRTGTIHQNPLFNPSFSSPVFETNIKLLKEIHKPN